MSKVYRVFASFPMHGHSEEEQRKTFNKLKIKAEKWFDRMAFDGYDTLEVINNMDATGDETDGRLHYLGQAIMKLDKVNAIVFSDDWMQHKGCVIERRVASLYGIPVI